MEIDCPHCNEGILIPDDEVSSTFECPFCNQNIELEQEEEETLPPKDKTKEKKQPPLDSSNSFRTPLNPFLCDCPACGRSVSKKADICPSCGHPIYRGLLGTAGTSRTINIIGLVFLILIFTSCLFSGAFMPLITRF